MLKTLKKINNIMRVLFVGFTAIFALTKIFDVTPKKTIENTESAEPITSEFDDIW